MALKDIAPWRWGGLQRWADDDRPFESFFREMDTLHREMERLFDDFWKGSGRQSMTSMPWIHGEVMPSIDVTEDDMKFHVQVELPGMDKDDVDITLTGSVLTIRGEKKRDEEQKGRGFFRKERSYGAFTRSLQLPAEVDEKNIRASFEKGVLQIELPKTEEAQKRVTHIDIKAA